MQERSLGGNDEKLPEMYISSSLGRTRALKSAVEDKKQALKDKESFSPG